MDPFVGEIRPFPYTFVPQGWAACNGQQLLVRQFTALFSLIGVAFGGDGRNTFGLPNLVGNLAVGTGQSPGGSSWQMGQTMGTSSVTINQSQMPAHNHSFNVTGNPANSRSAIGNQLALASTDDGTTSYDSLIYVAGSPNVQLNSQTLPPVGAGQPHTNMMPSQALSYCIALVGIFPQFP